MTDRTALLRDIARVGGDPDDWHSPGDPEPSITEYVLSQIALGQEDERSLVISLTTSPPNADEFSAIGTDPETFAEGLTWYLGGYLALDPTLRTEIIRSCDGDAAAQRLVMAAEELVTCFEDELEGRSS